MTIVRTRVAKSELTFSTPTFPKIAVRAANTAESTAQKGQDAIIIFMATPGILAKIIVPPSPSWYLWPHGRGRIPENGGHMKSSHNPHPRAAAVAGTFRL